LYRDLFKNAWRPVCHVVLLPHQQRDLKIGMHFLHIDDSKVTNQFLIFCLKAEIGIWVQSFIFTSLIAPINLKLEKSLWHNIFCSNIKLKCCFINFSLAWWSHEFFKYEGCSRGFGIFSPHKKYTCLSGIFHQKTIYLLNYCIYLLWKNRMWRLLFCTKNISRQWKHKVLLTMTFRSLRK